MAQIVIDNKAVLTTPRAMMQAIDDNFDELYSKALVKYTSLATLRAETVTPTADNVVFVKWHSTAGDAGGGLFYWSAASVATDNGGTIIKLTSVTTGRYLRIMTDRVVTPNMFGAKMDGSTDDTSAINSAISVAVTDKLILKFLGGTYKTTSTINITEELTIEGDQARTIIAPNFATGDVIKLTGINTEGGVNISGIQIKPSVTRTAGYLLNSIGSYYINISNCIFWGGYNGVGLTGAAAWYFHMRDCFVVNQTNYGVSITANTSGQGPVEVVLSNIFLHGTAIGTQMVAGINVESCGDILLEHVQTLWTGIGLRVMPPSGYIVQALFVADCFFDTGTSHGIYSSPVSGGVVQLLKISDTWCASNSMSGIYLGGGSGTIQQTDLSNCVFSANGRSGIEIETNTTNTKVDGCSCSANTNNGISIGAGVTKFKIVNSTIGASGQFGGNTNRGVLVSPGASDQYIISHNIFASNGSDALYDGGTGTNKVVSSNVL